MDRPWRLSTNRCIFSQLQNHWIQAWKLSNIMEYLYLTIMTNMRSIEKTSHLCASSGA